MIERIRASGLLLRAMNVSRLVSVCSVAVSILVLVVMIGKEVTTMWEVFYLFVDAVLERLQPLVLRFPRDQYAIELARRFEEEYGIP